MSRRATRAHSLDEEQSASTGSSSASLNSTAHNSSLPPSADTSNIADGNNQSRGTNEEDLTPPSEESYPSWVLEAAIKTAEAIGAAKSRKKTSKKVMSSKKLDVSAGFVAEQATRSTTAPTSDDPSSSNAAAATAATTETETMLKSFSEHPQTGSKRKRLASPAPASEVLLNWDPKTHTATLPSQSMQTFSRLRRRRPLSPDSAFLRSTHALGEPGKLAEHGIGKQITRFGPVCFDRELQAKYDKEDEEFARRGAPAPQVQAAPTSKSQRGLHTFKVQQTPKAQQYLDPDGSDQSEPVRLNVVIIFTKPQALDETEMAVLTEMNVSILHAFTNGAAHAQTIHAGKKESDAALERIRGLPFVAYAKVVPDDAASDLKGVKGVVVADDGEVDLVSARALLAPELTSTDSIGILKSGRGIVSAWAAQNAVSITATVDGIRGLQAWGFIRALV